LDPARKGALLSAERPEQADTLLHSAIEAAQKISLEAELLEMQHGDGSRVVLTKIRDTVLKQGADIQTARYLLRRNRNKSVYQNLEELALRKDSVPWHSASFLGPRVCEALAFGVFRNQGEVRADNGSAPLYGGRSAGSCH
jgi:hypothetical protein